MLRTDPVRLIGMPPSDQPAPSRPHLWFLPGPPLGEGMFTDVVRRLGEGREVSVLDPAQPGDGWAERGAALAAAVRGAGAPVVLVAHGLAVPAAIAAATLCAPALLILSDGPITRLDPVTRVLARLAASPGGLSIRPLLQPAVWCRWLASSAGLRRAVANPYVMDHDTVVALARPLVAERAGRRALASYLASLGEGLPDVSRLVGPTALVWGTEDGLYPASEADYVDAGRGGVNHISVPGGRWLHPVERPWAFADAVRASVERFLLG